MKQGKSEKPGRKTSEFALTVTTAIITGSIGLGIIDPHIIEFGITALENAQSSGIDSASSAEAITDSLFKLVALVIGGNVVSSYTKSRGSAKQGKKDQESEDEE